MENQSGKKLNALRADNGLEFCNNEQNGIVEMMNWNLLGKVKCILI